ncbi:MAG TPA: hypothetical protein VKU37_08390 [Verrucomicrobiae bacterium]|nr:hypothetical protein [Verrucomicrobiae bacterium]
MKTSIILFAVACGIVAGGIVYLNHHRATPAPIADSAHVEPNAVQPGTVESNAEPPPAATTSPSKPAETTAPAQVASADPSTVQPASTQTNSLVDALLHARKDKSAMLDQLRKDGHLDDVIAGLQQRMAANPSDPEIPTTLGEALLNKVKALYESGNGDRNQMGILAMQADQNFNTALQVDPKNWEAQFVKCSSMYYWPASPDVDNQVVQRLSGLIDQQDGMPVQPEFAQPYIVLGNEYQKIGKEAEAQATWALGAQKFPGDPTLQQKLAGK